MLNYQRERLNMILWAALELLCEHNQQIIVHLHLRIGFVNS